MLTAGAAISLRTVVVLLSGESRILIKSPAVNTGLFGEFADAPAS